MDIKYRFLSSSDRLQSDNVNRERNPESAFIISGNVFMVGFFEGWGIFRFQMGNEEKNKKKTLQSYAAAQTMKSRLKCRYPARKEAECIFHRVPSARVSTLPPTLHGHIRGQTRSPSSAQLPIKVALHH